MEELWIGKRGVSGGEGREAGKMVEWDGHHYARYRYDCTQGATPHCVQPEK